MKYAATFAALGLVALTTFAGEGKVRRSAQRIPGRYVVVLEQGSSLDAVTSAARNLKGARVRQTYGRGLKGFSVEISDADAQQLSRDPRVMFVEEDSVVSASVVDWGLDRVDQRLLPLDGSVETNGTGAGVTVYVVDTGIRADHADFGGRVQPGFSAFAGEGGTGDCHGHGTHVAGVVGGSAHGVATAAALVPVRVLDCNGMGSVSGVLAGLDWVLQQPQRPAVVNLSLGGAPSSAIDHQVGLLLEAGLTTVVAAGNQNNDACGTSPARVGAALTVGASTESDQRASFSNYGPCVDVFAPGQNIISDWYTSPSAAAVMSGTSSAAPFVAGVAALCLEKYPEASPASVSQTLLSQSTRDVLSSIGDGSPNRLLFSLIGALDEPVIGVDQLLSDPGFDYGTTFWASDICTVLRPTGCAPMELIGVESFTSRSGKTHVSIGGPARSFHLTSEFVTVPSTVRAAELNFYLWVVTKNKKSAVADVLDVEIRDERGALLEKIATYSNLDACDTWIRRSFDVTRYRGRSIRVSFLGVQSNGAPTWFLLDDVTLNVKR